MRKKLLTILTLLWMVFIFFMSSAGQETSDGQSDAVCDLIGSIFVEDYEDLPPEEKAEWQDRITFPVRKGAHMTEYAILGALLALTACEYLSAGKDGGPGEKDAERTERAPYAAALAAGFLYAASDEFHQRFVPGRSGELRDVLIDTAGVLIGICIVWALKEHHRK